MLLERKSRILVLNIEDKVLCKSRYKTVREALVHSHHLFYPVGSSGVSIIILYKHKVCFCLDSCTPLHIRL